MKKIFITLFIVVVGFSVETFAQNSLDDFIKSVSHNTTKAESNQNLLNNAVESELSIIRQQYRLENKGNHYGKNNLPYYGETYSLAIKVSGGLLFMDDVVAPWKNDDDYQRTNASGKYKTEYFWTYQRGLRDSSYVAIDLELEKPDYAFPINDNKTLYKHLDAQSDFGLSIDDAEGKKEGYMVWAYSTTTTNDSAMVVELKQVPYSTNATSDSTSIAMSPSNPEKIIGGLFVVPRFEKGGRVQFMLVGAAVKTSDAKWDLQLLTNTEKANAVTASDSSAQESSAEPTPIKSKKSKK